MERFWGRELGQVSPRPPRPRRLPLPPQDCSTEAQSAVRSAATFRGEAVQNASLGKIGRFFPANGVLHRGMESTDLETTIIFSFFLDFFPGLLSYFLRSQFTFEWRLPPPAGARALGAGAAGAWREWAAGMRSRGKAAGCPQSPGPLGRVARRVGAPSSGAALAVAHWLTGSLAHLRPRRSRIRNAG